MPSFTRNTTVLYSCLIALASSTGSAQNPTKVFGKPDVVIVADESEG